MGFRHYSGILLPSSLYAGACAAAGSLFILITPDKTEFIAAKQN